MSFQRLCKLRSVNIRPFLVEYVAIDTVDTSVAHRATLSFNAVAFVTRSFYGVELLIPRPKSFWCRSMLKKPVYFVINPSLGDEMDS